MSPEIAALTATSEGARKHCAARLEAAYVCAVGGLVGPSHRRNAVRCKADVFDDGELYLRKIDVEIEIGEPVSGGIIPVNGKLLLLPGESVHVREYTLTLADGRSAKISVSDGRVRTRIHLHGEDGVTNVDFRVLVELARLMALADANGQRCQ